MMPALTLLAEPTAPKTTVLHPGDVACGHRGDRLETLLGSCIAMLLTDPRRTLGAMCHFVHTRQPAGAAAHSSVYAHTALDRLYSLLRGQGIVPQMCVAFVAGGGNMFPGLIGGSHVGDTNTQWALDALARDGIQVIGQHTGGNMYRRLAWTIGDDAPQVMAVTV